MFSIYIDISQNLEIILFDDNLCVIDQVNSHEPPSKSLHFEAESILSRNEVNKSNVNYIFNKGPGSYTGLRLLQGFEDVLRLENFNCFNLYSFEILKYLKEDMHWKSPAFKNEIFLCKYENKIFDYRLVSELESFKDDSIGHHNFKKYKLEFENLIKDTLRETKKKEIFYYRSLEKEFNKK